MAGQGALDPEFEHALLDDISRFYDDPLGFVRYAFPWGEPGALENYDGPDDWQAQQLADVGEAIRKNPSEFTVREAIASGHGIGKSAETAMIILWAMSTRPHLAGVVTANTKNQLTTKTWRELAVWHKRAINSHWFKWTATKFFHVDHESTWAVNAIPNNENNSEAFAGLHGEHVLIIYDEASAIPDKIWEVTEGAMTTPRAMWFAYGNPTRNAGRFHACFHEDQRWNRRKIDSRTCKMTNKAELQEWVDTYGEDSDFVRVRIRGEFPRAGSTQFIPSNDVDIAMMREYPEEAWITQPIILAADVARFGDDKSIIALRQGRKLIHLFKFRELDTMEFAREIASKIREFQPVVSFVDEVGVGAGVVDRLRQLGYEIVGVNAGSKPDDGDTYYNKRAEMWGRMREWIRMGGQLPKDDMDMRSALVSVEYGFTDASSGEKLRLESKKDMKKRGLDSPDEGDAIAYTFAELIAPTAQSNSFEPEEAFEPEY